MMIPTVSLYGEDVNYKDKGYKEYKTNNDTTHKGAMSEAIIKIPEDIQSR